MECRLVLHVYRVDVHEVWPSSLLTGLTLGLPSAVNRWTLSWHACIHAAVARSACDGRQAKQQDKHNPQGRNPRQDHKRLSDRQKIKEVPQNYIDPLATDTHPPGILNVVTCLHATVNDESIIIGREQMAELV